jgi:hypothetical protein
MIRNRKILEEFEISLARQEAVDYRRNLDIYEALHQEARLLGVFPLRNPLDGIEVDLHLARVIHARTPA